MKNPFYLALMIAAFSQIVIVAQNYDSLDNANKIITVLMTQKDAWNRGDIESYMDGYCKSDSLKFVGKSGIKYGWKQTLEGYRKGYVGKKAMGLLHFEVIGLDVFNQNNAFMLGKWEITRDAGNISGYFTLVWKYIERKWVIIIDHSS